MANPSTLPPALRWALYEGVYYAALELDPEDIPAGYDVPSDHAFVFFVGTESASAVPRANLLPYDPNDTEKASHPAAAEGAAVAANMLREYDSAQARRHGGVAVDGEPSLSPKKKNHDGKKKKAVKEEPQDEEKEDDEEGDGRRHRRQTARTKVKKESLEEQEGLEDEEEEGEREMRRRRRRKRRQQEEDEEEEQTKKEEDNSSLLDSEEEGEGGEEREDAWRAMEKHYGVAGKDGNRRAAGGNNNNNNNPFGGLSAQLHLRAQSLVTPYIARIQHEMEQLRQEARETHCIIDLSLTQVVERVEKKLSTLAAQAAFLERCIARYDNSGIQAREERDRAGDHHHHHHTFPVRTGSLKEMRETLKSLRENDHMLDIASLVKSMVRIVPPPDFRDAPPQRFRQRGQEMSASGDAASGVARFIDPATQHMYNPSTYATAPCEVGGQEKIIRYHEQRRLRLQHQSRTQGSGGLAMGKSGLYRPGDVRVLERWMQAKALIPLAPIQESQMTKPSGYYSAKYSAVNTKMEEYALRRLHALRKNAAIEKEEEEEDIMERFRRQTQPVNADQEQYHFHDMGIQIGGPSTAVRRGAEDGLYFDPAGQNREGTVASAMLLGSMSPDEMASFHAHDATLLHGDGSLIPSLEIPQGAENFEKMFELNRDDVIQQRERQRQQSMAYPGSVNLPSEGSVWAEESEKGEGTTASKRHSSQLSLRGKEGSAAASAARTERGWREEAKKVVLRHLTLYLKGLKGKPRLLPEADFSRVAKLLLERATQHESQQRGVSLKLEVHNRSIRFTSEMEAKLKKSVDGYVQRHYSSRTADHAAAAPQGPIPATALSPHDGEEGVEYE